MYLWTNKMGARCLAKNSVLHVKTKYIAINLHFVRERVGEKALGVKHISFKDEINDLLTKVIPQLSFKVLTSKLNHH